MKNNEKISKTVGLVCKIIILAIVVAYFALLIVSNTAFKDSADIFWISINIFSPAGAPNAILRVLAYAIFILTASWVVRFVIKKIAAFFNKGRALIDIIASLIKYIAVIILIFLVLKAFGVDTTSIIAGIGIVSLIVGLAAQPLLTDVIAGLFIVFEHVFEVGDIIVVSGFRGTVKEIGIRTTRIEDAGGNVKIINNADLRALVNMSEQLSLANCEIGIEYGESLERVEAILKKNLDEVKKEIPDIVEGPIYRGVSELGGSAVVLKFVAKCKEGSKYQVERDMNRQFKLLFDRNGINIPFAQIVVNEPISFENATNKDKQDAKEFVEAQKELAQKIPDSDREN
ncbi:MAG: mechanosensitive ion channel family protein [Clostridia bacterium]|nr:mechanosensitive ion channel family protein [Clostridia bacterium]